MSTPTSTGNSLSARIAALVFSLVLNACGNALSIASNFGSGIWTASAVNMHAAFGLDVGLLLFIIGFVNALTNQLLIHRLDIPRFAGEILFVLCFSYFVDLFTALFTMIGIPHWNWIIRMILSMVGVSTFCVAISIYQRANIFMHPNDDTTNILRFMYLKGNATASQLIDFVPPIVIMIITFTMTHQVLAVNVGTFYSFIMNGILMALCQRVLMEGLCGTSFTCERGSFSL
ncbi:hypothetical protein, partial [Lactiplantibacillus daowaiensis]